ncbi:MAG: hypothetical protein K8T10_05015 [Candidatus Eremiobacteraeota bacterium]|nr:hypothetical protein [Candidatus Eremiobacteraeota bacterium]
MNDYLLAIIIGVLSSFVASLIFLLFLTRVRPNIVISNQIAKSKSLKTGELVYIIRIINKTKRPIIDIKAQLHLINLVVMPGGVIKNTKIIALKTSEIMEISKFDSKDKMWNYAYRFIVDENIETKWENSHSFLRFKISAKDSLSGFSRVFSKNYHTKINSIQEGKFEAGNSLEIK